MRCGQCFSLVPTTSASCGHCASVLQLEPELVSTALCCPRCARGLFLLDSGEVDVHECKSCGGLFVDHESLTLVITAHRPSHGSVPSVRVPVLPPPETQVRYLPCPVCTGVMNRAVFGRKSGVVIDTCRVHGTFFDARELTGCIAFVEEGGIERAEKQALERKRDEIRRARIERRASSMYDAVNAPVRSRYDVMLDRAPSRPEGLIDLMHVLLGS